MRILFLTHRLPYAPNRGDRVRAFNLLRVLRPTAEVDLVSLVHDDEEASHASDLELMTSSVRIARVPTSWNTVKSVLALPGRRPTTHTMLNSPALARQVEDAVRAHRPDVVLAYCSGMARLVMDPPLATIPFVLDMVDVDSAKWSALAQTTPPPRGWVYAREARVLSQFEARAAREAFATLVVTENERLTMSQLAPDARVEVVQNGVDLERLTPTAPPPASRNVVFCGVMNYAPNEEGAVFLARDVWPLVRRRVPAARLQIVGASPSPSVERLARAEMGVEVTGAVPEVRDFLWGAAVATAPLFTARGIQNKVLEAVAAGVPTVVTPLVMSALPDVIKPACTAAATPEAFSDAIVRWLESSPAARRAAANTARLDALSWNTQLATVPSLLRAAARSPRRRHATGRG